LGVEARLDFLGLAGRGGSAVGQEEEEEEGEEEGFCGLAEALDRGADVRLVESVSSVVEGLRADDCEQRRLHQTRNDPPDDPAAPLEGKRLLGRALKSLESTLKVVITSRGWPHSERSGARELIQVCYDNCLIPECWQQHFTGLRVMLESSVPTPRNRLGGHGQGGQIVDVPPHFVSFALHMTASTLVFLIEADAKYSPP
jgi:hypothetical protein